jgi:hypothetical protein
MFSIFTFSLFDTCLHLNFSWSSVLLLTTFSVNSYSNYFLVSSGPSCLRLLFSLLPNWKCRSLEQICAVRRHDKFSILHRSTDKTKLESHLILVGKLSLSCPLHFLSFGYFYDKTIASLWNTSSYKGITNLTCQGHLLANWIQNLCSCRFSYQSVFCIDLLTNQNCRVILFWWVHYPCPALCISFFFWILLRQDYSLAIDKLFRFITNFMILRYNLPPRFISQWPLFSYHAPSENGPAISYKFIFVFLFRWLHYPFSLLYISVLCIASSTISTCQN